MSTLYIECKMGAAGDMLAAALYELLSEEDKKQFIRQMNSFNLPGVEYYPERVKRCGIDGTHMVVKIKGEQEGEHIHDHDHVRNHDHGHDYSPDHEHEHRHGHDHEHVHDHEHRHVHDHEHSHTHEHHHSSLQDIEHIVTEHLHISDKVRTDIMAVYELIAGAESRIHGTSIREIHFHEVGTMDAVADITAVCLLLEKLSPDRIVVSPINVGSGTVRCAHGVLPVPAPATALILEGIPIYSAQVEAELCTPTGAALLRHFASDFGDMPMMSISKVGYGMGTKDFKAANCVRAIWGENSGLTKVQKDIIELSFNVDDMTGEQVGFAMETLLAAGALEVFTVPVGMKKSRPGIMFCVILKSEDRDAIRELIFKHTTTIGIRETCFDRYTLAREIKELDTKYGKVHVKISSGYGTNRQKYEYEDIAAIARDNKISLEDAIREISNE